MMRSHPTAGVGMTRLAAPVRRRAALALALLLSLALLAPCSLRSQPVAPQPGAALRFMNGDILFGAPLAIEPGKSLVWRHPGARRPIELTLDHVTEIRFPPAATRPSAPGTNLCHLRLVTQDTLPADLGALDASNATVTTWFGGALTVPRRALAHISPVGAGFLPIYSGPTGLDGWTVGQVKAPVVEAGQWSYKDGAFFAEKAASIARDFKLPDRSSIAFDLAWKGSLQVNVALHTDYLHPVNLQNKTNEPPFGGFYTLQIANYFANLIGVEQTEPLKHLGTVSIPTLAQKSKAHFEIRVNRAKNLIAMLVDGVVVKQWTDPEKFVGTGGALRFVNQSQGKVKFSNLAITHWDGLFEETGTNLARAAQQDTTRLRNGDWINGAIESIRDGVGVVSTGATRLRIPLSRVRRFDLADDPQAPKFPRVGNVRAWFDNDSSILLQLERWTPDAVVAQHPILGKISFHPDAFVRIQFIR
jgi:hypothetical protein